MKTLDEAANEYADKEFPNANDIDAPFTTTGDLYEIARESFVLGANWQASQGWVSCKDRLPELNEPLIGYNDEGEKVVYRENCEATVLGWNEEDGIFKARLTKMGWSEISSISHNGTVKPLYWMPLPQPPKQD